LELIEHNYNNISLSKLHVSIFTTNYSTKLESPRVFLQHDDIIIETVFLDFSKS